MANLDWHVSRYLNQACAFDNAKAYNNFVRANETYHLTESEFQSLRQKCLDAAKASDVASGRLKQETEDVMDDSLIDSALAEIEKQKLDAIEAEKKEKMKKYAMYGGIAAAVVGLGYIGYRMMTPKKKTTRRRRRSS